MGFMDLFKAKKNEELTKQVQSLSAALQQANNMLNELGYRDHAESRAALANTNQEIAQNTIKISEQIQTITGLEQKVAQLSNQQRTATNRLTKSRELYKSITYAIDNYPDSSVPGVSYRMPSTDEAELDELAPSVILKLHAMDVKDLRKAYRDNDKQIALILDLYSSRYTTKANQAIYKLMVIALRAELQNILYNLKYEKLDTAVDQVKSTTAKYLAIAADGNQSIAGTLSRFIGEIEYLFINAVKIEYNYYVKREQAKQEQAAIREQMRQEAAERKALEAERKKIEQEEEKYKKEIERIQQQLDAATDEETEQINSRILELRTQLSDVLVKKEDVINLQNGKAGNIYIISNLGSFGEDVFKIGMTRRMDPQDRVDELSNASVPFKFDVHSFIFSDDAVSLEGQLHEALANKRVNKVNLRKEFFRVDINELEELVTGLDPTAEFNSTMLAEEFRESLSTDEVYTTDFVFDEDEEEE